MYVSMCILASKGSLLRKFPAYRLSAFVLYIVAERHQEEPGTGLKHIYTSNSAPGASQARAGHGLAAPPAEFGLGISSTAPLENVGLDISDIPGARDASAVSYSTSSYQRRSRQPLCLRHWWPRR